jgi:hypothetical protein
MALGAAAVTGAAVLLLWPTREVPEEEQVRRRVVQMVAAAEKKDVGGMMEGVSEAFRSQQGGWDKPALRGVMVGQVLRGEWVRIISDLEPPTRVAEGEVQVRGRFIFARSQTADLAELARQSTFTAYQIDALFRREADGQWRAVSASHRQLDGSDLL